MMRIALVALLLAAPAAAQDEDYSKVEIKTQTLSPGIAVLFGSGGNIGVSSGPDGTLLIDDQFAPLTPKILAAVAKLGAPSVRFLLNTHWHFDHSGGNENIGKTGTVIIAQDNVRRRMAGEQVNKFLKMTTPASPHVALPVVTFGEGISLHLNDDDINIVHVHNAHTDGDALVKFTRANVLHTGDVFVRYGLPFIDTESGGSARGMIAGCDKILAISNDTTKIIPGHGEVASRADVVAYRTMLVTIVDRVDAGIKAGKSLAVIQASKPAAQWDKDPKAFVTGDAFVATIYGSLKAPASLMH